MKKKKIYPLGFVIPALTVFTLFFLLPMVLSFFFSLTVWNFKEFIFVGLDNFKMFLQEDSLNRGIINSLLYAVLSCAGKVIIAFLIAAFLTGGRRTQNLLRSLIFFPNLISTIAIGITFCALMHPTKGLFNLVLQAVGLSGVNWLGNVHIALFSVIGVEIWRGVGVATVIYIAGIQAIDKNYYEAAKMDGATKLQCLRHITMPLVRPSRNSIILLSFLSGMRCFDLIWAMTGGGPGFATDVMASVVYKQYAAGYYGLSTAGNVIMFVMIALIVFPLQRFLLKREEEMA
ncbi:carbohydrate ABC transporter permease [Diplocloster modestus]|uniref:Sugar ABC transporter permease n=1 Tax=Diplocloster modestus TaxID=2850322 RepID=A0ABS6KC99_9FIRM|nr:sugar ABC transporter permease [Diplocloster modestus]MBU9728146.1 sugar ABC transporter permease [Diplocloster modestus]